MTTQAAAMNDVALAGAVRPPARIERLAADKPRPTGAERIETARRIALAANVTLPGWMLADVARPRPHPESPP